MLATKARVISEAQAKTRMLTAKAWVMPAAQAK
jgi:hypothetical protein